MINNKRGDKILSAYWFAVLLIVAGGIFAMVYVFYGVPYDTRSIEAHLLINAVADCISYAGKINSNIAYEGNLIQTTNFLNQCHLIFNSSEWDDEQYYTEVNFYKVENPNDSLLTIKKGNNNWISQCAIQEEKTSKNLVQCSTKLFYSLDDSNNQYLIKILGVVRKSEKNVKL
jgi:uncharacterized protein involved in tolerance to divalent cations